MLKLLIPIAVLGLLASCSYIDKARDYAAEGGWRGVVAECSLSDYERKKNFLAINDKLAAEGEPARVTPFDCDGDGAPDVL